MASIQTSAPWDVAGKIAANSRHASARPPQRLGSDRLFRQLLNIDAVAVVDDDLRLNRVGLIEVHEANLL